ncbi:transcrition adapter 2 [Babesia ovis]|uniref:Transcrition adapter 2 n=1 Tax=Babesia ovis TaxID=5869 RepID=A0A9W5TEE9_BABOV|nr:transcrition adapter 2 [Babesia ovis]
MAEYGLKATSDPSLQGYDTLELDGATSRHGHVDFVAQKNTHRTWDSLDNLSSSHMAQEPATESVSLMATDDAYRMNYTFGKLHGSAGEQPHGDTTFSTSHHSKGRPSTNPAFVFNANDEGATLDIENVKGRIKVDEGQEVYMSGCVAVEDDHGFAEDPGGEHTNCADHNNLLKDECSNQYMVNMEKDHDISVGTHVSSVMPPVEDRYLYADKGYTALTCDRAVIDADSTLRNDTMVSAVVAAGEDYMPCVPGKTDTRSVLAAAENDPDLALMKAYNGVSSLSVEQSNDGNSDGKMVYRESHMLTDGVDHTRLHGDQSNQHHLSSGLLNHNVPSQASDDSSSTTVETIYPSNELEKTTNNSDSGALTSHQDYSEPRSEDATCRIVPHDGVNNADRTQAACRNSNNDQPRGMDIDRTYSNTLNTVKQEMKNYVDETHKYCMWSLNPQTGDHEFDPGPLAVDFYCNVCQASLPLGTFRIRCVECVDFDLCIPCACKGAERNEHKNYHKYIPIAPHSFTLFGDWNADAELLLLEGISKFGFGNWNQVADMVNRRCTKNKSATECEHHYNEFYIHSPFSPFPDIRHMNTLITDEQTLERFQSFFSIVQKAHSFEKPRPADAPPIIDMDFNHIDIIPPAVNISDSTGPRLKFFQSFPGYNLYRDELDPEHNNDAESIIKDLEFEPWDTPAEVEFKLRMVEIYNCMLDDRICHKRILIHRFWNDYIMRENNLESMNQIEKAAYWRLTPLIRFQSETDHLNLTKLVVTRIELEKRLRLVATWKSFGLQTLADVESFGLHKFPSAYATSQNAHVHPITRDLLTNGFEDITKLEQFAEQQIVDLCSDLLITRGQMESMMTEIAKMTLDIPIPVAEDTTVFPTWDYCFRGGTLQPNVAEPLNPPPLQLNSLPDDYWHPRLVVEGKGPHELPTVDLDEACFSNTTASVVQQSQAFSGLNSCLYIAKYVPQNKSAVRKIAPKRRRNSLTSELTKGVSLRK